MASRPADHSATHGATADGAAALAARQAALAAALTQDGAVPAGFDAAAISRASRGLVSKRAGELAAEMPSLRMELGEQWLAAVRHWSKDHPRHSEHSRAVDLALWWIEHHDCDSPLLGTTLPGTAPSEHLRRMVAAHLLNSRPSWLPIHRIRVGRAVYWLRKKAS